MTDPVGRQTGPETVPRRWVWHPWRLLPPLLVLLTVLAITATRFDVLRSNHWAYPATLAVVGVFAAILVIRARPRPAGASAAP